MNNKLVFRLDWMSIMLYIILVVFGMINIYSTRFSDSTLAFWDLGSPVGKQFWIFVLCLSSLPIVLFIKSNFFEHLSYFFYGLSIVSLIGLFVFGNEVNGALAWYKINGFSIQPSEFAKPITALALAKYLSDINSNIKTIKTQFYSFLIILIPITLIILQPDPGTIIIFLSFILVFYKIGLPSIYMNLFVGFIILFFATILLTPILVPIIIGLLLTGEGYVWYFQTRIGKKNKTIKKLGRKIPKLATKAP